jgi:DNA-binding NarL/FixJ family response regulator
MALRIVVAEDDLLVREGIVRLLSGTADLDVVASCGDYDEAVAAVETQNPDVVLTDIRMPPTRSDEGIRLARRLRASHPMTGVVVVSQYSAPDQVLGLFEAGSDRRAYLLKEHISDRAALVSAIRSVASGGAEELSLTKRTVEKNVNSIFLKLGLGQADHVSKRVKAVLIFLTETQTRPVE